MTRFTKQNSWIWTLVWAGCVSVVMGCSSGGSRAEVTGEVTVDSQPLREGTISLLPDRGHRGPAATTSIQDGRFKFDSENGPVPGKHRVVVSSGSQLPNGQLVSSLDEASAVAKKAPQRPNPGKPNSSGEPKPENLSPSRWETEIEVPAIGSAEDGKPLKLDFQTPIAPAK